MHTEEDYSYGVIPLIKEGDDWKVFLINQYGSAGDVYWTFPKGHKEDGESDTEAALRELAEETSITLEKLVGTKVYTQEYSFRYNEHTIHKKVSYFIGIAQSNTFLIQADEVKEAGWFGLEEARERITYDPAKIMFDAVSNDIQTM